MNFLQNEYGKRTGIFNLKNVSIYGYKNMQKNTMGKNNQQTTYSSNIDVLLNKSNPKLFTEKMVSYIMGHPVFSRSN